MSSLEERTAKFIDLMKKIEPNDLELKKRFDEAMVTGLKEIISSSQCMSSDSSSIRCWSVCFGILGFVGIIAVLLVSCDDNAKKHLEHMAQIESRKSLANDEIKTKIGTINSDLAEIKIHLAQSEKPKSDNEDIKKKFDDIADQIKKIKPYPTKCCQPVASPTKRECPPQ
ncbi:hypothetical protein [Methylomonas sp. Kb3]|uniref:hypothetical protein n=1 Tax=Methylomonas sp. Kb3 TaxID=1611544 RepID=UPI0010545DC2|nr:hypothetical protein [Methylomonas sp. Kb3]